MGYYSQKEYLLIKALDLVTEDLKQRVNILHLVIRIRKISRNNAGILKTSFVWRTDIHRFVLSVYSDDWEDAALITQEKSINFYRSPNNSVLFLLLILIAH